MHQKTTSIQFERPLLRIGSITFLIGLAIFIISTEFHASREDPTNHLRVFAEYANSTPWIAAHIGQFVGGIVVFAGGFVTLFRLLVQSESMTASVLAWIGFATAIIAASVLCILQAVDGIALKRAVDSWAAAPIEEKTAAFRVAEGIDGPRLGLIAYFAFLRGQWQ
jgi:protein-S-isoprenylcysteine O-methyltransferase Ste14